MATIGVYKITNTVNNKCYIGASSNIENRISTHLLGRSNSHELKKDLIIYGKQSFTSEILIECDLLELKAKENYYINLYSINYKLYNASKKSTYINENTKHSKKNTIELGHIDTFLIYKECVKQGITKPKKQDLVNCAFQIANNKLNEILK